jgi:hypothetical protein
MLLKHTAHTFKDITKERILSPCMSCWIMSPATKISHVPAIIIRVNYNFLSFVVLSGIKRVQIRLVPAQFSHPDTLPLVV